MCGIVGLVNGHPVAEDLVKALGQLEYRGYDSAGMAVAGPGLSVSKVIGGAATLRATIDDGFSGHVGIAHTRWATHGRADERNAHPHVFEGIAVVHNGIVENHWQLRERLIQSGHRFISDTDSEVIPHLIAQGRSAGLGHVAAVRAACEELRGAYAIAVLFEDQPDRIVVARWGSPVLVARGPESAAVASDCVALPALCDDFAALEDGDIAELSGEGVVIVDQAGHQVDRIWNRVEAVEEGIASGAFSSQTRAEIAAQPVALDRTDFALRDRFIPDAVVDAARLILVACGSSLCAAGAARPWIEQLTEIPCDLEIASEFRLRDSPIAAGSVAVLVSQSGETADTLGAMEMLKAHGVPTVAVVNVAHSQMARGADLCWPTTAGREQGVAAAKSFTCQMLALVRFGLALGLARGVVSSGKLAIMESEIAGIAAACAQAEALEPELETIAQRIAMEGDALFIGRGSAAALAAEGALKLKELSYLHAEAFPAGELKHGPIAMVREGSPVIVLAGAGQHSARTLVSAEEVRARGAYVIALVDSSCASDFAHVADSMVVLPGMGLGTIFTQAVALQLIAVHGATTLGRPVDRPRNLAKSVTVE